MEDSIFTKIIKGDIPAHKIYEDEQTLAFLDIKPLTPGHTIVVPKKQVDDLWKLDEELYAALMQSVRRVARRMQEVLQPLRVGMALEGFGVPDHVHVHVFPIGKSLEATYLEHAQQSGQQADDAALTQMTQKLSMV